MERSGAVRRGVLFGGGEVVKATDRMVLKMAVLAGMGLAASVGVWAQSSASAGGTAQSTTPAAQAPAGNNGTQTTPTSSPTASQPAPGTTPVGGDAPAPAKQPDSGP